MEERGEEKKFVGWKSELEPPSALGILNSFASLSALEFEGRLSQHPLSETPFVSIVSMGGFRIVS